VTGVLTALASLVVAVGTPSTLAVDVTPAQHAAHPSTLTLQATVELQCSRASAVTVGLPSAMGVRSIPATAAVVNGVHAATVRTSQHTVRVTMPPPQGMMCDSIGPSRVTVRFTKAAGLVNPKHPGSYAVWLQVRGQTAAGRLKIS
jgi:hypothetical protein